MARRTAQAEWTGELNNGLGEVTIPGDARGARARGEGRERRALEGEVVSRMRAQARRRRASSAIARPAGGAPPAR
jgi:hypothetical protein